METSWENTISNDETKILPYAGVWTRRGNRSKPYLTVVATDSMLDAFILLLLKMFLYGGGGAAAAA